MHDTNLFGLLHSFNLTSFDCLFDKLKGKEDSNCYESPPYASHFKFVLYL